VKLQTLILKQPVMNRVLFSLVPLLLFSVFIYGWRCVAVVLVSNLAAFGTEYLFIRHKKGGKVSMAVFVTGSLLALTLPPTIPLWMAALGSVVAVAFGKMVFGGFGANLFNPAILGQSRAGQAITTTWQNTWLGFEAGSLGETSALLIILAGIYLLATKSAKWIPMLATLGGILLFSLMFYPGQNPLFLLGAGGALFGIVFMVTDPISQPKTNPALWIYGGLTGFLTVFIRRYSLFAEGFMFALLITNSLMPIIEHGLKALTSKKAVAHGK